MIQSKIKISSIVTLLIVGIGMLVLSSYILKSALNSEYPQIDGLILGGLFGALGAVVFLSIFFQNSFILTKDKLILKTILGNNKRTIHLSEILSYTEIEKETRSMKWKELTIYTKNDKIKLPSSRDENYMDFKRRLTKGKKRDLKIEKLWSIKANRKYGVGFLIFSFMIKTYLDRNTIITKKQIATISNQLIDELKFDKTSSESVVEVIKIKLANYDDLRFNIEAHSLDATIVQKLFNEVNVGDIIEIDLELETFEKKIAKTKALSFVDKSINYKFIPVYGLRKENSEYLRLDDYNFERKTNSFHNGEWTFALIGLGIMIYAIILLILNERQAAIISKMECIE